MSIILRVRALKTVRKPGGVKQWKTKEKMPSEDAALAMKGRLLPKEATVEVEYHHWENVPGSDYVVFICPHCEHRNNRPIYHADYAHQGILGIKCKMCRKDVEVERELPAPTSVPLIVTPEQFQKEQARHGPNLAIR